MLLSKYVPSSLLNVFAPLLISVGFDFTCLFVV